MSENKIPNIFASVGPRIKELRKESKWTQQELGRRIGVSAQVISNWERGYTSPSHEDIAKLAKELDVSSDYIIFGYDPKELAESIKLVTPEERELFEQIESFIEINGWGVLEGLLENKLSLEKLFDSNVEIMVNENILSKSDKEKIISLIKLMYE